MTHHHAFIYVQARMSSHRLPGKMLMPILGQPLILHLLDRLAHTQLGSHPILLTADNEDNKPLIDVVRRHGYFVVTPDCDEEDVLSRFVLANEEVNEEEMPLIRVCGDSPLVDPSVVDQLIDLFYETEEVEYAALANQWADGLDIEMMSSEALSFADEKTEGTDRQHVTPWIWQHKDFVSQCSLPCPLDLSNERWCVDDMRDFLFVNRIFEELYHLNPYFGWREVLGVVNHFNLNKEYHNREARNSGYLKQAGIEKTWEEIRFPEKGA